MRRKTPIWERKDKSNIKQSNQNIPFGHQKSQLNTQRIPKWCKKLQKFITKYPNQYFTT